MPQTPGMQELIDWLIETTEPLEGQKWNITLNSDGAYVEATAKVTLPGHDNHRGHRTIITKTTTARFRIGTLAIKRKVFSTD